MRIVFRLSVTVGATLSRSLLLVGISFQVRDIPLLTDINSKYS